MSRPSYDACACGTPKRTKARTCLACYKASRRVTNRPGWQGDILTQTGLVGAVIGGLPAHVKRRLDVDDMRQAGLEGLLNARRLYDPARGTWSTYAYYKIRWSICIAAGLTRSGWEPLAGELDEERLSA